MPPRLLLGAVGETPESFRNARIVASTTGSAKCRHEDAPTELNLGDLDPRYQRRRNQRTQGLFGCVALSAKPKVHKKYITFVVCFVFEAFRKFELLCVPILKMFLAHFIRMNCAILSF